MATGGPTATAHAQLARAAQQAGSGPGHCPPAIVPAAVVLGAWAWSYAMEGVWGCEVRAARDAWPGPLGVPLGVLPGCQGGRQATERGWDVNEACGARKGGPRGGSATHWPPSSPSVWRKEKTHKRSDLKESPEIQPTHLVALPWRERVFKQMVLEQLDIYLQINEPPLFPKCKAFFSPPLNVKLIIFRGFLEGNIGETFCDFVKQSLRYTISMILKKKKEKT